MVHIATRFQHSLVTNKRCFHKMKSSNSHATRAQNVNHRAGTVPSSAVNTQDHTYVCLSVCTSATYVCASVEPS